MSPVTVTFPDMAEQRWRLEPVGGHGALAWLYLSLHRVTWAIPSTATEAAGYTITEEPQALVDDELGAFLRYSTVRQT